MDFNFTPEEEAFRQELRAWLHSHLPAGYDPERFDDIDADARFEYQRTWQRTAHQDRWVGIHWPRIRWAQRQPHGDVHLQSGAAEATPRGLPIRSG